MTVVAVPAVDKAKMHGKIPIRSVELGDMRSECCSTTRSYRTPATGPVAEVGDVLEAETALETANFEEYPNWYGEESKEALEGAAACELVLTDDKIDG